MTGLGMCSVASCDQDATGVLSRQLEDGTWLGVGYCERHGWDAFKGGGQ